MKRTKTPFFFLGLALLISSCAGGGDQKTTWGTLENFVDQNATIEAGERYKPDLTEVKTKEGKTYTLNDNLFITAQDSQGNDVPITNGSFTVTDMNGYTVFYRVYEGEEYRERKVTLSVKDSTGPSIQILGLRSEREIGTFALPTMRVKDNSGENLAATYEVLDKSTGKVADSVTINKEKRTMTFVTPGEYVFHATAADSHGNVGEAKQDLIITEKMAPGVWENFDNERHMEVIKNIDHYTSQTTARWLESYKGKTGVAEIRPNYKEYYYHSSFVQLGLNKTVAEMMDCHWNSFTLSMYVSAGNESTVKVSNGSYLFGEIETGKWVDFKITRKAYLVPENSRMFPNMISSDDGESRYLAFAKAITGDTPRLAFAINSASDNTDVKIYLDAITWEEGEKDTEAPKVRLEGATWRVQSHTMMTIPTIVVEDNMDSTSTYENLHFYYVNSGTRQEISISNGKVQIGDEGTYQLVVGVRDESGNYADRVFTFTASDELDQHIIATYDAEEQIGGTNGEVGYVEDFNGAKGVMSVKLQDAVEYGSGFLQMQFPKTTIDAAIQGKFDYIRFRMYVACETSSSDVLVYSWISNLGKFKPNQWVDFDLTVKGLSYRSFLSWNQQLSRSGTYSEFVNQYVNGKNILFYLSDTDLINNKKPVTYYFDSIEWGIYHEGDYVESVKGLKASYDLSTESSIALPTIAVVSDGILSSEKEISSISFFQKNGSDWNEIQPNDGRITFPSKGEYKAIVKVDGCPDFNASFIVEDLTNAIYSFSSDDVYTEEPKEVWYPAKGEHVTFDYHNGRSTWMEKFTGKDGVTEYGVLKANQAQSSLRFDIGNKKFEWDAIKVRIYFEAENASRVGIYSTSSEISYRDGGLPANTWTDLTIKREMLHNEKASMYALGSATYNASVDDFYDLCFGRVGYNNQSCFQFDIYNYDPWKLLDTTVYISLISWVKNS